MNIEDIARTYLCIKGQVAVVGASPKKDRTSYEIMSYLLKNRITAIPVNPSYAGEDILGEKCLASVKDLPEDVGIIDMVVSAANQGQILREIGELTGRPVVWFQPGAENEKGAKELEARGFPVVSQACIMVVHSLYCTEEEE
ncbi:MAG: CoA-binding protein [Synergistales bacterium]|nr:CoA-binding protein [Synergistales bacterium]